jgi:hypothetical protein
MASSAAVDEEEYDPEAPPELILGRRVSVEWSNNRWYSGVIDNYNEDKNEHHIHYDDNDKRWYKMPEKTWKFENASYTHRALKPGSYLGYQGQFLPYTPKDAKSRTTTTFYTCIDQKILRDGERPILKGNLAALTTWEGAGVPMNMLGNNPSLW